MNRPRARLVAIRLVILATICAAPAVPSLATTGIVVRSRQRIVLAADIRAAHGLNPGLQQKQIDHKVGLIESGNAKNTIVGQFEQTDPPKIHPG
jgi:hypothetical protein